MFEADNSQKKTDFNMTYYIGDGNAKPFVPDSKSRLKVRDN
jgi:hypothetical protein